MGEFGTDLSEELGALANGEAPPSAVSAVEAVHQGRSRLRRRRPAALGGMTAALVGVSTLALAVPDHRVAAPAAVPSASSATPAVGPALRPDTGHDPLTTEVSFGWLPANFTGISYMQGASGPKVRANGATDGPTGPMIWLTLYPAGTKPTLGTWSTGGKQYQVDAPPVNGRSAYFVGVGPADPSALGSDHYLRFETADGRWAELQSVYMGGSDLLDVLHRVAEGVQVGHWAVPLPYRISSLPASAKLSEVDYHRGGPAAGGTSWTASLNFAIDGKYVSTTVAPDAPETTDSRGALPGAVQIPRNCTATAGLTLCTQSMQGSQAYDSAGGPQGWLGRFTLLGTDESKWTTDVIS